MRDNSLTAPWKYGVYTNLVEVETQDARYAHGHLVTSEHMGLMLRTTACLGDEQAFGEAYDFVSQTMVSPLFQVINWTVDQVRGTPFLQQDELGDPWRNGNAPLEISVRFEALLLARVRRANRTGWRSRSVSCAGCTGRA